MPGPKAHARAAILAGAMTFEPAPLDMLANRIVPAIRRLAARITPPLDLRVMPFRYRIDRHGSIEAVRPKCRHARRRSSARS